MKKIPSKKELADAIEVAAREAFSALFKENPGCYYYCSLITTGEAHTPIISAWSKEALAHSLGDNPTPEDVLFMKWSYADSPFCSYGQEYFNKVNELFEKCPRLTPELSDDEWSFEFNRRLESMEIAMTRLNAEGLFGKGQKRLETVVLVEVMPPDYTNTERALRLNPKEALQEWLIEAAE